jgi:hypothetical protein
MTNDRDVTIKAQDLDKLLQLAMIGNRVRSLSDEKVRSEAAERLQSLDRLQDRADEGLANTADLPLNLESSTNASRQASAGAPEDLPLQEMDKEWV